MKNSLLYILLCLLVAISCKRKGELPPKINDVLLLAGDNSEELVRTIHYFSGDSFKLKAALFLIENLEDKYSYTGDSYNRLQDRIASFRSDTITDVESSEKYNKFIERFLAAEDKDFPRIADARILKSSYLIEHIEESFKTQDLPWVRGRVSFDQFCRNVLPYKVGNEPVEDWHKAVSRAYGRLLDSLSSSNAIIMDVAKILNDEIARRFEPSGSSKNAVNFDYTDLTRMRAGSCYDGVSLTLYVCDHLAFLSAWT